jgi:hypothetical protein
MENNIIDFPTALTTAESLGKKRHLLLGNGFSISWNPKIFQYGSLFDRADFPNYQLNLKNFLVR